MAEKLEIWGVKDPNVSAQLALASQLNLFKREAGLDIECRFIESGTTMPNDILKAEKKPFAFMQTPITAILLNDKGMRTKIIAPVADIAGSQQVIIREPSKIVVPKDLAGKRIGMAKGAAVYIALMNMAKDCHVDLEQVYFINLLPSDQIASFAEGRLDAIACWEPWTTEAKKLGGKFYFSGTRCDIPGIEGNVNWLINQSGLIVPDEHLERNPDTLVAILEVLQKATTMINYYYDEVSDVLSSFFGLPLEDLTNIMQKNTYSMTMDTLFRIGILSLRDFLYQSGRISTKIPEHQLYTTTILRKTDPTLVALEQDALPRGKILEKNGVYYQEGAVLKVDTLPLQFMLVDDSRFVRKILYQVLEILGGEVVGEAINGNEAIAQFTKLRPNFVTMDLSMPGLSGIDAIRNILQIDPDVNIIVISGIDVQEVREEVFNLGVKMLIPKPFDPENAAEVIRSMLANTM